MDALNEPLRALIDDASWFVRATEHRLLYVQTTASMRKAALQVLQHMEYHADNRAPVFTLEAEFEASDAGWEGRVEALRAQAEIRRTAMLEAGVALLELAEVSTEDAPEPVIRFARQLMELLAAFQGPMQGALVILCPPRVEADRAALTSLEQLVRAQPLREVRWVVLETDTRHFAPLASALGAEAMTSTVWVDEGGLVTELEGMAERAAAGQGLMAGPSEPRPQRLDRPEPPTEEALAQMLQATGVPPAFVLGGAERLRARLMQGAVAARKGDFLTAVEHQRAAVELCAELGMWRELVQMQMMLGGYVLHLRRPDKAREIYRTAITWADEAELPESEAQGWMALAMLDTVEQRHGTAGEAYLRAARLCEAVDQAPLSIECYRLAGEAGARLHRPDLAAHAWERALGLSRAMEPKLAARTSAVEVGRALAKVYRDRRMIPQAEAVEAHTLLLVEASKPAGNRVADSEEAAC